MGRIGNNGRWRETAKGWRYICNDEDSKVINRWVKPSVQVVSLDNTHVCPLIPTVWECVLVYVTSPTDLRNLAVTCRALYKLVENELAWTSRIRTKFGSRLWLRHVRQSFHRHIHEPIDLHVDIETMEKTELLNQCTTIPRTFLLNRIARQILPVARAMLCSYRYHLQAEISKDIIYMPLSEHSFRQFVSFSDIHSEHLSDVQRQTVPLTKLIYFYLMDRRHLPAIDFGMIYPRETIRAFFDIKASTGRALQLSMSDIMIVLHPYHSIMPGGYEIFWRLPFISRPIGNCNLEFIAIPQYGLMVSEHTSSKQFAHYLNQYDKAYFRRSMGIITVFKRCTVFVGCLDLTRWQSRTEFVLDYIEIIAVN